MDLDAPNQFSLLLFSPKPTSLQTEQTTWTCPRHSASMRLWRLDRLCQEWPQSHLLEFSPFCKILPLVRLSCPSLYPSFGYAKIFFFEPLHRYLCFPISLHVIISLILTYHHCFPYTVGSQKTRTGSWLTLASSGALSGGAQKMLLNLSLNPPCRDYSFLWNIKACT